MKTISSRSVLFCAASLFISMISFAQTSTTNTTNQSKIISEKESVNSVVALSSNTGNAKTITTFRLVLVKK